MATDLDFTGDHAVMDWQALEDQTYTRTVWISQGTVDAIATTGDGAWDNEQDWISVLVPITTAVVKGDSFVLDNRRYLVHDDETPPGAGIKSFSCRFNEWT